MELDQASRFTLYAAISVVSKATVLRALRSGFRIPVEGRDFFVSRKSIPGSGGGGCPLPIKWLPDFFSGVKRPEHEANHSPPSSAEVTYKWHYICPSPVCLPVLDRGKFTFLRLRNHSIVVKTCVHKDICKHI
jgi:hypothetical protein